jgi:RNA-binding protein YlmH
MKEDDILLAGIEDKIRQCEDHYTATNTTFLDVRQRTLAETKCRQHKGLRHVFYGGYEDAERTVAVFLPDYAELSDHDPLALLRITQSGQKTLTHRDYLGSILGLGIRREIIGDILVRDNGADIVIIKEMGDFLLFNYEKAGRASLKVEVVSIGDILLPEVRFEEKRDTVASLRLDNVVASAFNLSRGKAAEAIERGLVFVNGLETLKADRPIKEGDRLVLRGKGKVLLKAASGATKKDRIPVVILKYL